MCVCVAFLTCGPGLCGPCLYLYLYLSSQTPPTAPVQAGQGAQEALAAAALSLRFAAHCCRSACPSINRRPPRIGRNPRSGESVAIPEKRVPHFKPGKALREAVDARTQELIAQGLLKKD